MAYRLKINHQWQDIDASGDRSLLDVLRLDLGITSVKRGCDEGVCGACMALVNGRARQTCSLSLDQLAAESEILTVEGLKPGELDVLARSFAQAGAVQCGFCTPGMIISASAILRGNPVPDRQYVAQNLRKNLCRCTGYQKIIDAVLLASRVMRGEAELLKPPATPAVGSWYPRADALIKARGEARYVDDLTAPGMLYGAVLRAPVPRAEMISFDTTRASKLKGVSAVLTAQDLPASRKHGLIFQDWPVLVAAGEETRYVGDALALVAAETPQIARRALELIDFEYRELPPVTDPEAALAESAPLLHAQGNLLSETKLNRGDPAGAYGTSKYIVRQTYLLPATEHAFLEPESALAVPEDGGITVHAATQSVFEDRRQIASILGLPENRVRVVNEYIGGAFGGKEDLSVQHHAALLALKTGRPVKLTLSRRESILVHPKRHAMKIEMATGCDEQGYLTFVEAGIIADTGAYASMGAQVLERACTHAAGPYKVPNLKIEGRAVYTNNPPAGAFRGFGVPQAAFACESQMDALAEQVGLSPWEFRWRNAAEPGDVLPTGQVLDSRTKIKDTLLRVKEFCRQHPSAGIACGMKSVGLGVGTPDVGRASLNVKNGLVVLKTGAACCGQGLEVVLLQIFCAASGLKASQVQIVLADSALTPESGTTTASRQSMFTGEAVRKVGLELKKVLAERTLAECNGLSLEAEFSGRTDPLNSTSAEPVTHLAYGFATQVVLLDDKGKISKILAVHDVGRVINPDSLEGQIEGAVAMGLGYALREDLALKQGVPGKDRLGKLGLFRANEMPEVEVKFVEDDDQTFAYGAKGVGEIATIPTAAAVANAYQHYDGRRRLSLPLAGTPYQRAGGKP